MSNEIILEGEYKNGKRNGKGKEYNRYGDIIFKGEYLNGKKWNGYGNKCDNAKFYQIINGKGNVNESDDGGIIFYEGEFVNGQRNGKGREYNIDSKFAYRFLMLFYKVIHSFLVLLISLFFQFY